MEDHIKAYAADISMQIGPKTFMGKSSGHIPDCGEQSPEIILNFLGKQFNKAWRQDRFHEKIDPMLSDMVPAREFGFCPGCPHRASYWAIKTALTWDDNEGFVSGDIGCYTMGIWPTGFNQVKSVHAMGSGLGLASGYGKLYSFGFNQPVITVCGDSTFFHAGIPALINAKFNQADVLLVILDNSATAMTGFQPHPGIGTTAMGNSTDAVDMEALCRSLGVDVSIADPYDMALTAKTIYGLLKKTGPRVIILRRKCALVQGKKDGFPFKMRINEALCLGEACGCNRYCSRIFRCPGLIWDETAGKAAIDEVICVGCGVCTEICPQHAIEKITKNNNDENVIGR